MLPQCQRLTDQHHDHGLLNNGDVLAGSSCGGLGDGDGGVAEDSYHESHENESCLLMLLAS